MGKTTMTKSEREAFLADVHVGVVSVSEPGRGPLSVPVWYQYAPGGAVRFSTGAASRKAAAMRATGRATLLVQTETAPYKYVSVEGPVRVLGAPDYEHDLRATAVRYLVPQMAEVYLASLATEHDAAVMVELTPERWLTVDYAKAFG